MRARQGFVPVGPVRAHLVPLRAGGMPFARIAALARLPEAVVVSIATAHPMACREVHAESARRLLRVHPARFLAGDSRLVDATGTRRRLQALSVVGWSRDALAARAGLHPDTIRVLLTAQRCEVHAAAAVRLLYDRVWDEAPPIGTASEREASEHARAAAAAAGWAPPLGWNDDELDDPDARPDLGSRRQQSAAERLDELVYLVSAGAGLEESVHRAGYANRGNARLSARRAGHDRALLALDGELERVA